jgi:phosphoglucomutase
MIRFGTSGWRAVISDEFTFANVRRVSRAIAAVVRESGAAEPAGVAVGYDTRFLSEKFAAEAAAVLMAEGIPAQIATDFLPTPVLAFAITRGGLAGGINVTASHNPPEYNGMKFSTADGAPAPPETTRRIEALAPQMSGDPPPAGSEQPVALDPKEAYFVRLRELIDVDALRRAHLKVGVDSRFGTTRGWLDRFLEDSGVQVVRVNDRRDPMFGGDSPDCSGRNLNGLKEAVRTEKLDLGLATDGDGDRFGVVDRDGTEVTPNLILALLADDLAETRGWRDGVGRTVATTHLLDRVAAHHGFPVYETPVGFKYFQPLLSSGKIFLGAEESAGLSVKGHVPEKDGILATLLVAEMVGRREESIAAQARRLYDKVGTVVTRRVDRRFDPEAREELSRRTATAPDRLAGVAVDRVVTLDGSKWIREDGAWLLVRISGTEPVVRIYAEAGEPEALDELVQAGLALLP